MDPPARRWPQLPPATADGQVLRVLDWAALCARLAAGQQLRRALLRSGAGGGSFDPATAAALARHARSRLARVNRDPSTIGNRPQAIARLAGRDGSEPVQP